MFIRAKEFPPNIMDKFAMDENDIYLRLITPKIGNTLKNISLIQKLCAINDSVKYNKIIDYIK